MALMRGIYGPVRMEVSGEWRELCVEEFNPLNPKLI
jgi:hypothetical protein